MIEKLRESGYPVTQATVSRDIKQLGLIKTATKDGGYKYTAPRNDGAGNDTKLRTIMKETIISAQEAQNIVVLKTMPGMATAAATSLDVLMGDDIVGSIAGDDTIFIVVHTNEDAVDFADYVKDVIGL